MSFYDISTGKAGGLTIATCAVQQSIVDYHSITGSTLSINWPSWLSIAASNANKDCDFLLTYTLFNYYKDF